MCHSPGICGALFGVAGKPDRDEGVTGSISYGIDQKVENVVLDKRDINTPLPHNIHYINLKNLSPSTKYFFTILSGDKVFKNGDNFYEITTPQYGGMRVVDDWYKKHGYQGISLAPLFVPV